MQLSRIHRGPEPVPLTRVEFAEFDDNGDLPQGSWVVAAGGEFLPAPPPAPYDGASAPVVEGRGGIDRRLHEAQLQEAFAAGRQQGLEEARERHGAALERLDTASEALGQALEEISRLREQLLLGSKGDLLRLVLAVARQVIHAEVSVNRDLILHTIERALQAAVRSDAYQVRIHPDDLKVAAERKPLFLASISSLKNITFEGDAAISRGGCLVESELGEVDATIDCQLEELRQVLLGATELR